jgi:ribosomal protein L13
MSWNLKAHITDHAEEIIDDLSAQFDVNDSKNVHFTASIDISQLVINHKCKSQKDIDLVMKRFLDDLMKHEKIYTESKGKDRNGERRVREIKFNLKDGLIAYHNSGSDSINSSNYQVEPHFHFLYDRYKRLGIGYYRLRDAINEVAKKHNLVFNFAEEKAEKIDKSTKDKATALTWFNKRATDRDFTREIYNNKDKLLEAIENFKDYYQQTGNIQYYIKGMRDLQSRLKRLNLDFYVDEKNIKDEYPLLLSKEQIDSLKIIQNGDKEAIRELIKSRDNKIARAYLEATTGFRNIIVDEFRRRGLELNRVDIDIQRLNIAIKQKNNESNLYHKTLAYAHLQDIKTALKHSKNEKELQEVMQSLGYKEFAYKQITNHGKRERVGFTYLSEQNRKITVYFSKIGITRKEILNELMQNSKNQKQEIENEKRDTNRRTDTRLYKSVARELSRGSETQKANNMRILSSSDMAQEPYGAEMLLSLDELPHLDEKSGATAIDFVRWANTSDNETQRGERRGGELNLYSHLRNYIPPKRASKSNKLFEEIYKFDTSIDLSKFYIKESDDITEFKAKGTYILDKGTELVALRMQDIELDRNVKLLVDLAEAKGWKKIKITGTKEFKEKVKQEFIARASAKQMHKEAIKVDKKIASIQPKRVIELTPSEQLKELEAINLKSFEIDLKQREYQRLFKIRDEAIKNKDVDLINQSYQVLPANDFYETREKLLAYSKALNITSYDVQKEIAIMELGMMNENEIKEFRNNIKELDNYDTLYLKYLTEQINSKLLDRYLDENIAPNEAEKGLNLTEELRVEFDTYTTEYEAHKLYESKLEQVEEYITSNNFYHAQKVIGELDEFDKIKYDAMYQQQIEQNIDKKLETVAKDYDYPTLQ